MPKVNKSTVDPTTDARTFQPDTRVKEQPKSETLIAAQPPVEPVKLKELTLPDWISKSGEDMPETTNRMIGDYLGFASVVSPSWGDQQNAGLQNGQMYIFREQMYYPLERLDFFIIKAAEFQTLMVGREGRIEFCTTDMRADPETLPSIGQNFTQPHYVLLLAARLENQMVPIKGDFRGTKSGGIETAIRAVTRAADPNWGRTSDAARVTLAFPRPFGRVFHSGHTSRHQGRTSGNEYFRFNCVSRPATPTEMQELIDALTNKTFADQLESTRRAWQSRVHHLAEIALKSDQQSSVK